MVQVFAVLRSIPFGILKVSKIIVHSSLGIVSICSYAFPVQISFGCAICSANFRMPLPLAQPLPQQSLSQYRSKSVTTYLMSINQPTGTNGRNPNLLYIHNRRMLPSSAFTRGLTSRSLQGAHLPCMASFGGLYWHSKRLYIRVLGLKLVSCLEGTMFSHSPCQLTAIQHSYRQTGLSLAMLGHPPTLPFSCVSYTRRPALQKACLCKLGHILIFRQTDYRITCFQNSSSL